MLKIFQATGPKGPSWTVKTLMGPITVSTREELDTRITELRTKAAKVAGRELSDEEFTNGPPKPQPTKEQIAESRRQQVRAERVARLEREAAYDPTQDRLRTARERAEAERIAALTPAQRELETATKAAQEAEQRKADKAKRAEIRATPAYKTLRQGLDDSILVAKLDPTISQEQLDALVTQSEALERTADIASVRSNVAVIQKAIAEKVAIQDAELQQAVSRAELRKKMLSAGQTWDSIDTHLVGDQVFVALTVGDRTVKISESKFNSRKSDESLKTELFGTSEVTND